VVVWCVQASGASYAFEAQPWTLGVWWAVLASCVGPLVERLGAWPHAAAVRRACYLGARFLSLMVQLQIQTKAKTDHRIVQMQKPKPKPKTKKTEISVRFDAVWFGFRFSV
jgi:hypothetical protein